MKALPKTLLALVFALLAGCTAYVPHPAADIPGRAQVFRDEVVYLGRDYQLSPGDEIEIIYHLDVELQDQYRLAVGDQLRVEFFHYPALDRTLDIRPDGKITVPYKGDIAAAGLTPTELADRVNQVFADFLTKPRCTVTLIRYGQRVRELKDAIKTASRGQSRLTLVAPDGRATLPLIAPVMAGGRTIDEFEREVNVAYRKLIPTLTTSATLLSAKGNVFYIFGAVNKPGYYELRGPTTTIQGVAIAGGFTPSAEASSTLLITRDEENRAVARLMNHAELLSTGNIGQDVLLRQADVIFVPNTKLSQATIIGEFIRRMIPIDLSLNYSWNQQVLPPVQLR